VRYRCTNRPLEGRRVRKEELKPLTRPTGSLSHYEAVIQTWRLDDPQITEIADAKLSPWVIPELLVR